MSELIDRVARAIFEASPHAREGGFLDAPQEVQDHTRAQARAALEAMREPSRAMVAAGEDFTVRQVSPDEAALWRIMVAAALEAPPFGPTRRESRSRTAVRSGRSANSC